MILVRAPRVIFAELKSKRGLLSPDQQAWKRELEVCAGVEFYVWKPRDREEIHEALTRVQ